MQQEKKSANEIADKLIEVVKGLSLDEAKSALTKAINAVEHLAVIPA